MISELKEEAEWCRRIQNAGRIPKPLRLDKRKKAGRGSLGGQMRRALGKEGGFAKKVHSYSHFLHGQ